MSQLALPLKLQDHAVFDSFWPAGNEEAVAFLDAIASTRSGPGAFVHGGAATGKSHLLQALCERAGIGIYLPLGELETEEAALLDGLAAQRLVCLDDVHAVTGNDNWELGLFELLNEIVDTGGTVVASAHAAPRACGFALADLSSRFARLPVFQLSALPDAERVNALKLRARHRGLDLPDDTATYMLNRSRRDMTSLYRLLDRLDSEALKAKRRLTIPFVREIIGH